MVAGQFKIGLPVFGFCFYAEYVTLTYDLEEALILIIILHIYIIIILHNFYSTYE